MLNIRRVTYHFLLIYLKSDSSESSSQSSEQAKETNQLIETEKKPLAKGNYKKKSKKSLLKLPMNDELPEFSPIIPEVDLKSRKNKKTDKAKAFKLFDMSNADSNSSSASSLTSNNEAIQNSTNQDKSNTCNDLMEANNEKTTAKSEEAPNSRVRPKRIISSSSVNSLKQLEPTVPRTRVKVAQKENKIESKSGKIFRGNFFDLKNKTIFKKIFIHIRSCQKVQVHIKYFND